MADGSTNDDGSLEEQLVAYLDGELDAQLSRQIEELLVADPKVRKKLQGLDRTWELLEELDATPPVGSFTQTTLEMVTRAAAEDVERSHREIPRRRLRRWVLFGGGLLAAFVAGFLAVAWLGPDRNRQLLDDLPLLERLDEYRQIDDIQFLRMLHQEGLFAEEDDDGQ